MPTNPTPAHAAEDLLARIADLEREVEALRAEVDSSRALSSLGFLTGAIAHEFNNILTPLLGYASAAMGAPHDAELARRAIERTAEGASRAARIAESVLELAGAGAGRVESCDVGEAVAGALACARLGSVSVRVNVKPGLRATIRQAALQQVVLNLVANAARAMRESGGELVIDGRMVGGSPCGRNVDECSTWNNLNLVELRVRDTGVGIDPEVVRHIGGGVAPTRPLSKHGGHGLGLLLSRRLIEAVGGLLRVEAAADNGTEAVILLPSETRQN